MGIFHITVRLRGGLARALVAKATVQMAECGGGSFDGPCMHAESIAGVVVVVGPLASNKAVGTKSPKIVGRGTSSRAAIAGMSASSVVGEVDLWREQIGHRRFPPPEVNEIELRDHMESLATWQCPRQRK